jgi:hypothetical protein
MTKLPLPILSLLLFFFSACTQPDTSPPQVEIKSPASGATLSGTVAVQVQAQDDSGIDKVVVYARAKGSSAQGKEVGSSTLPSDNLFLISFAAGALPNLAELELVAQTFDITGREAVSPAVPVKVSNAGAPTLSYLVAFTLPPKPTGQRVRGTGSWLWPDGEEGRENILPDHVPTSGALRPLNHNPHLSAKVARPSTFDPRPLPVQPLAELPRTTALEWGWSPIPGADGYGIYLSKADLGGPYDLQVRQAASASGGQRYSKNVEARPGESFFGVLTVLSSGGSQEGVFSNADGTVFLSPQDSNTPADNQTLTDGRPTLSWTANPFAEAKPNEVGYLYYIFDKNPWEATAKLMQTNFPNSTDQLTVNYPTQDDKGNPIPALAKGSYYWWVAGVTFNKEGKADAFSFSDPKRFVVP